MLRCSGCGGFRTSQAAQRQVRTVARVVICEIYCAKVLHGGPRGLALKLDHFDAKAMKETVSCLEHWHLKKGGWAFLIGLVCVRVAQHPPPHAEISLNGTR